MLLRLIIQQMVREKAERALRDAVSRGQGQPDAERERHAAHSTPDESVDPLPPCDVGVVFASDVEAGGLIDRMKGVVTTRCVSFYEHRGTLREQRIVVAICRDLESGIGAATKDLIEFHRPGWVIASGFAAALQSDIERGTMLMVEQVLTESGTTLETGLTVDREAIEAHPGTRVGRLLTVDQILRSKNRREALGKEFDALAADQESSIVAEVCAQKDTRFMSIRTITDEMSDELPTEIRHLIDQKSLAGKLGATAGALWRRPGTIKELWRFKQQAVDASDRLAKFLKGVIEQLH